MMDETFLTTEEVLEYLQVNLRTVYRLIKAGKIPAVRVGRQSAGRDVQRLPVSAQVGQRVGASEGLGLGLGLGSKLALHGGRVCQTPFGGSPTRIPSEGGRRPGAASDAVGGRRHPPLPRGGFRVR